MTDWYLEDKSRLNGRPKETIAEYVESQGILIPRRFASLEEARKSKKRILLRSEHPQEYDGVSGLLDSFCLSDSVLGYKEKFGNEYFYPKGIKTLEELKEKYFDFLENFNPHAQYKQFCKITQISLGDFRKEAGFSIWQALRGYKKVIVADTCIAKRWHVMTQFHHKGKYFHNYGILEEGKPIKQFIQNMTPELEKDTWRLIEGYERIRNLPHFDNNHCPIMEFITSENKDYFLQYHRCRDFVPVDFTLDREPEEGEKVVPFVRGATGKEGMTAKVTVYYAKSEDFGFDADIEEGSYDFHWNNVFPELQVRKRKLQCMEIKGDSNLELKLLKVTVGHDSRSKMFKPQVSIIHDIDDILNGEKTEEIYERTKTTGKNQYIDLRVVSDGRKAYVKRI